MVTDMQQLWAPWRLQFILQPKTDACFLCDAARGDDDRGCLLLCRTEWSICVMNRYPYNNGHLLVAPQRHEGDLEQLRPEELTDMNLLLQRTLAVLREAIAPQGFNIGANIGKVAGAGIADHLHMHVVPRWDGDTNFMPVLSDVKVVPQSIDDLYGSLRPKFDENS